MSDLPGRSAFESDGREGAEDDGWGSPVPAQYGSLRSVRGRDEPAEPTAPPSASAPPASADGKEDRWGMTSLLRRLQGEFSRLTDSAGGDGSAPAEAGATAPTAGAAAAAPSGADRLSGSPEIRRVRWYDDPAASGATTSGPAAADG